MKWKVISFDSVKARNEFLTCFFPDRKQVGPVSKGLYRIQSNSIIIVDGKEVLFILDYER